MVNRYDFLAFGLVFSAVGCFASALLPQVGLAGVGVFASIGLSCWCAIGYGVANNE